MNEMTISFRRGRGGGGESRGGGGEEGGSSETEMGAPSCHPHM